MPQLVQENSKLRLAVAEATELHTFLRSEATRFRMVPARFFHLLLSKVVSTGSLKSLSASASPCIHCMQSSCVEVRGQQHTDVQSEIMS